MAADFNKVVLMGRLTRDPETRQAGQSVVCEFGLATSRHWFDKAMNQKKEETCYTDIVVWGRQGETAAEYLSKDSPALVEGYLKLDEWNDRNSGEKRSKLRVVAENVVFLGNRADGQRAASGDGERPQARQQGRPQQQTRSAPSRPDDEDFQPQPDRRRGR